MVSFNTMYLGVFLPRSETQVVPTKQGTLSTNGFCVRGKLGKKKIYRDQRFTGIHCSWFFFRIRLLLERGFKRDRFVVLATATRPHSGMSDSLHLG